MHRAHSLSTHSHSRLAMLLAMVFAATCAAFLVSSRVLAVPGDDRVLILDTTVSGGLSSTEAQAAIDLGFGVDVVDGAEWASLSASDFGAYRAIILGDPSCGYPAEGYIDAPIANADVWGPAVDGNVMIVGTDPELHGKVELTQKGVALATSEAGKTGAYITLSCYYHGTPPGTAVPLLDGLSTFGSFTATGVDGCMDSAKIVADHPAISGLTDDYLSNWACAVHEAFSAWPSDFLVLAMATPGTAYTAPDGSEGTPYILARGQSIEVQSDIDLTGPSTGTVSSSATFVATVTGGETVSGLDVTFTAKPGSAHEGVLGTVATNAEGVAALEFTGTTAGSDIIVASFVDGDSLTQTSGSLTITWAAPATPEPATPEPATPEPATPEPATPQPAAPTPAANSLTMTVVPDAPKPGVPADYEAEFEHCFESCTFYWSVDGEPVATTVDTFEAPDTTSALAAVGDTAEDFVATSRVSLALSVGTHEVSVRVESGDDSELETAATVVVAAPAVTPPPTSTGSSIARSSAPSLSIGIAFVVVVTLVAAAGASMVRARQRSR